MRDVWDASLYEDGFSTHLKPSLKGSQAFQRDYKLGLQILLQVLGQPLFKIPHLRGSCLRQAVAGSLNIASGTLGTSSCVPNLLALSILALQYLMQMYGSAAGTGRK